MKKIFLTLLSISLLGSFCLADCCTTQKDNNPCPQKEEYKEKCAIEDDEYCVFNECYFDKHFKKMKKELCLSKKQETCIDKIYKDFKRTMESKHEKYRKEKNKLLEMIECNNDCYKNQIKVVKEIKKEIKECCKQFREDIKEQLCKSQYGNYRKFLRNEKRKMKKIIKYGAIYKLPCKDCCK